MSLSLEPVQRNMNALHIFTPYFFKIHFNIILSLRLMSYKRSLPSHSPTKILYTFFTFPIHATCPSHPPWFDYLNGYILNYNFNITDSGSRAFQDDHVFKYSECWGHGIGSLPLLKNHGSDSQDWANSGNLRKRNDERERGSKSW